MPDSSININAVIAALSSQRVGTYVQAYGIESNESAMELYGWNSQVSAAFMVPLHICEVTVRNAIHEALSRVYGDNWPWSDGFIRSLPNPPRGYNPRQDVEQNSRRQESTGKVIPELKFVFWQKALTKRNDARLWRPYLLDLFPNHPAGMEPTELRGELYQALESIRLLRNRIAHHEPIFARHLEKDFDQIKRVLNYRCADTANWMLTKENLSPLLAKRPC